MLLRATPRVLAVALGAGLLAGVYFWVTTDLPGPEQLRARVAGGNTRLLDRRGRLLYQVPSPQGRFQTSVPLDDIPLALRQATIAIEDRGFYQNPGFDLSGIGRAVWLNLRQGQMVAGGSTITQQLARNLLLDPGLAQQRTLERKLRELVLAVKLTRAYSKDALLELYLNQTYYSSLTYGVEAAAQHFFGKPVRALSLAECALLAGLPQAPAAYDPFADPAAASARQGQVLDAMVQAGFITPDRAAAAWVEPLKFRSAGVAPRAPHFVRYVLAQLPGLLGAEARVPGGLTITTTLDLDLQQQAQAILRQRIAQLSEALGDVAGQRVQNGAVIVLDPSNGAILAMVGSPDFADPAILGELNTALSLRQPGSAIKPLTYAAALERGWTPASVVLDIPATFPTREGRIYAPQNYDRVFHGPLSMREALATSSNVAAVRTLDAIGIPALLEIAQRLGISTLSGDAAEYGLPLTLGDGEVTLLELTAAYGAFANGGYRVSPNVIQAVSAGQGSASGGQAPAPREAQPRVLSPQVAYLISDMLSDNYARMRAFGATSPLEIDRPAAVKTGTSNNWRDNWTLGYTPDRVVGVWVGNVDGRSMENVSGVTGAGPIWHDLMLAAHRDLPPRPFVRPPGIIELPVCAEGGMLPSDVCPASRLERFIAGTEPTRPDTTHVWIAIDPARGCRVSDGASREHAVERIFRQLPPEAEDWAIAAGIPRPPQQICPAGSSSHAGALDTPRDALPELAVTAPAAGTVFAISPNVPREHQRIELQAQAGAADGELIIFVDGRAVATLDRPPYRVLWTMTPGRHAVFVEARDTHGNHRRSQAVTFFVQE